MTELLLLVTKVLYHSVYGNTKASSVAVFRFVVEIWPEIMYLAGVPLCDFECNRNSCFFRLNLSCSFATITTFVIDRLCLELSRTSSWPWCGREYMWVVDCVVIE